MKLRDLVPQFMRTMPEGVNKGIVNTWDEGPMDTSWDWGWWQQDKKVGGSAMNSTVEACVSALSQTTAMCPLYHYVDGGDKGLVRKKGSNLERVILNPNTYQTRSGFFVDVIRSMYLEGNAFVVAQRGPNNMIKSLHLMNPRSTRGYLEPESGQVFYYASPDINQPMNLTDDESRVFPSRDVMHLRMFSSPHDPLRGETPLQFAVNAIAANNAMTGHQKQFFGNMSRPSGVLTTDATMNREQMKQLREAWETQSQGVNSGKIPILANGLKFDSMSLSSQDAQLVEAMGMTVADISRAFRVPLVLVNDMSGATFNNSEQTMSFFLMSGLGFLLDHIELEIAKLWDLPFDESVNYDTSVLLRTNFEGRMKGLGEAVLKGIYSPNEARAQEGLPAVEGGHEPRVQQQVQPLSAFERQMEMEQDKVAAAAAAPDPEPIPEPDLEEEEAAKALVMARNAYQKALNTHVG